jgi:hypothetical protein
MHIIMTSKRYKKKFFSKYKTPAKHYNHLLQQCI